MKTQKSTTHVKKAVSVCIAFLLTTGTAFAQITLDLGVLADEYPVKKESAGEKINLENPKKEKTVKPARPVKPKKPAPAKKATAKKTSSATKTPAKAKEKYQVKETAAKDEHDKLKPQAAPAPKVKVISSNSYSPDDPDAEGEIYFNQPENAVPKISKHFLEKQNKDVEKNDADDDETDTASALSSAKKNPAGNKTDTAFNKEPAEKERTDSLKAEEAVPVLTASAPEKSEERTQDRNPSEKTGKIASKKENPSILNFSVYPVFEKMSEAERSSFLANVLPQDSGTVKILNERRLLTNILIFEKKSAGLTEEMQNVLNDTARMMKKNKSKRLVLYSYSSKDPAEPGKERQHALRRALAVRSYLTSMGVLSLRIELRAQGAKGAGDKIPDRTDMVMLDR